MEQDNAAFTFDEARVAFDRLTAHMAEIAEQAAWAPPAHHVYHQSALLSCYGQALELLRQYPDVGKYYLEQAEKEDDIENADELCLEQRSLRRLQSYVNGGLLTEGIDGLASEAVVSQWQQVERAAQAHAFKALFADAVAIEPVVVEIDPEPPEDEILDDPNSINALDIMELVEEHTFTDAEKALIRYALSTNPVNMAKLRGELWELIALPKVEFDQLAAKFDSFRSEVNRFLKSADIQAIWVKETRGNSYRLLIAADAEKYLERDPKAGVKELFGKGFDLSPDRKRVATTKTARGVQAIVPAPELELVEKVIPQLDEKQFLLYVQGIIDEQFATEAQAPRLTRVGRIVADSYGITHAEACGQIKGFVDTGELFYARDRKGSRTVATTKPTDVAGRARAIRRDFGQLASDTSEMNEDTEPKNSLTLEDVPIVAQALSCLIAGGHQNRGKTVKTLALALGVDEAVLRPRLNRLVQKDVLKREKKWTRSRSPRSTKKEEMYMQFKDQATWDSYKAAPRDFVVSLVDSET